MASPTPTRVDEPVDQPVIVVSSDTHVGPRVVEQLRQYCPSGLLDDFDAFTSALPDDRLGGYMRALGNGIAEQTAALEAYALPDYRWNAQSAGHHDVEARLADMDRDGVAAEVVFHGSINGEPLPFVAGSSIRAGRPTADQAALVAEGQRIYNRWLADFCSVEPHRHAGMCQVPMWDVERSIDEVVWAHEHGLRGVNFPAPSSALPPYEDPVWDRFFAVCAERGMVLNTHLGAGDASLYSSYQGPAFVGAFMMDSPFLGRRGMWLLTFTGTFERHPDLKLVLTELPGTWWQTTVADMDAAYANVRAGYLREQLPRRPSEYIATNVFMGASFQSRGEAEMAVDGAFDDRVMWGSDYPHVEGTWVYADDPDEPSVTRLSLAHTFHDLPPDAVRRMAGANAVGCFGLDADRLAVVARRIGPTTGDLQTAPDLARVPEHYHGSGFRLAGSYS